VISGFFRLRQLNTVICLATSVLASHMKVFPANTTRMGNRMPLDYARYKYNPVHSSVVYLFIYVNGIVMFAIVSRKIHQSCQVHRLAVGANTVCGMYEVIFLSPY
jgi:hypothetical protein